MLSMTKRSVRKNIRGCPCIEIAETIECDSFISESCLQHGKSNSVIPSQFLFSLEHGLLQAYGWVSAAFFVLSFFLLLGGGAEIKFLIFLFCPV